MKNIGKATRFDIDRTLKEIKFLVSKFSSVRKIYFIKRANRTVIIKTVQISARLDAIFFYIRYEFIDQLKS